jgi:hypothetical protein
MESKDKKYYRTKLSALRNAIDELLQGLGEEGDPAPRKRRNLKVERVEAHETNYAMGTWKKPTVLRKQKG